MEGPASTLCLTTCYIKHCKPLGIAENPPGLGQTPLSRSCSCSRRIGKQERSNVASKCALPIIPEYPGFQDVKSSKSSLGNPAFNQIFQDVERGKNPSAHLCSFPRRGSLAHGLGSSSGARLAGHQPSSPAFQDKPLQEYFNERLMELGSSGSERCSRKSKGFAEKSPGPLLRGPRRRSSCGAALLAGRGREGQQPCSSASQHSKRASEGQKEIQNVLKLYSIDLDLLTMHLAAPLEVFVQRK